MKKMGLSLLVSGSCSCTIYILKHRLPIGRDVKYGTLLII